MPTPVLRYAKAVAALGALLLLASAATWEGPNPALLAGYVALAALASTFKVRLPGITGTVSPGFAVLLASVVELGWAETSLLAAVCGIVQTLWHARQRPALIQIAFNTGSMLISAAVAFQLAHRLIDAHAANAWLARLAIATPALFAANTMLVAVLLSLLEGKSAFAFWRKLHLWTFSHYAVGAIAVAALWVVSLAAGLALPWLAVPVLYLQFVHQRESLEPQTAA